MTFSVIETGSSGNCFIFNESVIVDLGLQMSRLKDKVYFTKVTHVLLTHIHGDHFNEATIRNISSNYKHITFVCGEWLQERLRLLRVENVKVIEMNKLYDFGTFKLAGVIAYHDVENCGYRLVFGKHKHFHITDTSTLEGITALNYDTATIECNYHTETALRLIDEAKESGEFTHLGRSMKTHLSVEECLEFCKANNVGELTPVHIGKDSKEEIFKEIER